MISNIHESWKSFFYNAIERSFFRDIEDLDEDSIYPEKQNIFRVFEMPIDEIRVVILGQDPYPRPNQAVGLAFAVPHREKKPPSLRMIEKEVGHELDRTMISWVEQGVFLLNTALTVKRGHSGSHIEFWKPFMVKLIRYISEQNPCIWMLWGKHAQSYTEYIQNYVYEYPKEDEMDKNVILVAAHPAAEVYKSNAGFLGSDNFNQANRVLEIHGRNKIIW